MDFNFSQDAMNKTLCQGFGANLKTHFLQKLLEMFCFFLIFQLFAVKNIKNEDLPHTGQNIQHVSQHFFQKNIVLTGFRFIYHKSTFQAITQIVVQKLDIFHPPLYHCKFEVIFLSTCFPSVFLRCTYYPPPQWGRSKQSWQ